MRKEVDIGKLGIALEDLEDIKVVIEELRSVSLADLSKEIRKVSKELGNVINDIDNEIGEAYLEIIEKGRGTNE